MMIIDTCEIIMDDHTCEIIDIMMMMIMMIIIILIIIISLPLSSL